jgi:hypothetical protein
VNEKADSEFDADATVATAWVVSAKSSIVGPAAKAPAIPLNALRIASAFRKNESKVSRLCSVGGSKITTFE